MKKKIFGFLILIVGFLAPSARAQYNTGDVELNASLTKIDANAQLDFGGFKADLSASYNVSSSKIDSWSVDLGMKAGDIYMALDLAKITKKPVDEVINVYQKNKTKGWGVMAKELGIKPGSPEFHALKDGAKSKGNSSKGKAHSKGKGKH